MRAAAKPRSATLRDGNANVGGAGRTDADPPRRWRAYAGFEWKLVVACIRTILWGYLREAGKAVVVHPAGEARQMDLWMRRLAVGRKAASRRWRRLAHPGASVCIQRANNTLAAKV